MFFKKVSARYTVAKSFTTLDSLLRTKATKKWQEEFVEEFEHLPIDAIREFSRSFDTLLKNIKSNAKYKDGKIVVYRCLNSSVEDFLKSNRVGDHWTYDSGNISCWDQTSGKWIVLKGLIDLKDVDWQETIRNNTSFDYETEVTLKSGGYALVEEILEHKTKKVVKTFKPAKKFKN